MADSEQVLIVLAGICVLAIAIQWFAWRVRLPSILLLLTGGFLAGPATGLIDPQELFGDLLLPVVSLCVGLILFEGGLSLRLSELKQTWRSVVGLLTVGLVVTWACTTLAAWLVLGLPPPVALILGAVLVVTGPTVIGPLLREIRPTGRVGAVAKWEGIVIDPVGATLAVLVFEAIDAIQQERFGSATISALSGLAITAFVGVVVGLVAAVLLIVALKRFWIPDFLQNPVTLMFVVGAFAVANGLHPEAGLLAVTLMGILLANQRHTPIKRIIEFKESLTVLLISILFVVLTARISLDALLGIGVRGLVFAAVLIFVIRPLSVWCATFGSGLATKERIFLAWFAPRGIVAAAVSSVFALRIGDAGSGLAPATFLVIFTTVAVYGTTAGLLARRLGLATSDAQGLLIAGASKLSREIAVTLTKHGFSVVLIDTSYQRIRRARDAGLTAYFSNVLSEQLLEDVDFGGLGRFLALTSNDEVNALAAGRFRDVFGRENVFRLAVPEPRHASQQFEWQHEFSGRVLFHPQLTYDTLDEALDAGAIVKVTGLTEKFTFSDLQAEYENRAWPLFIIEGQRLTVVATDTKLAPKAGQQLVSLVRSGELVN